LSIAITLTLSLIFLAGAFFLTALNSALRRIHKSNSEFEAISSHFFYQRFHEYAFPKQHEDALFFAVTSAQNLCRFCYAFSILLFILEAFPQSFLSLFTGNFSLFALAWIIPLVFLFLFFSFLITDYLPRILGNRFPHSMFHLSAFVSSIFLFLAFPISYVFLKFSERLSRTVYFNHLQEPATKAKQEIIQLIEESQVSPSLDLEDKKLIESVLEFKERIAREVMVPRVNIFSLPVDTTIKDAIKLLEKEGYSRIPVYRNTVDNIVGVLMYKDLMAKYMEYEQNNKNQNILDAPIETIQKNVLYSPETKKISALLQEFRKKQVHLAIIVDEYGGTEGIVTIEDILEEIVGDIADEYDDEEELFIPQPDGSWIIDARMSILDIDEQLDIKIPQEGEYDTIGGYIFHCAGSIPSKGFIIHRDNFEIEILQSNDRCVEKVKLRPIPHFKDISSTT
jgi:CBS domain containing-hemolysin-like protein